MKIIFVEKAWDRYTELMASDPKLVKKINALIKDIRRGNPFEGIGEPEPLKYQFAGFWSRRITQEHRLVYAIDQEGNLIIASCYSHYSD